MVGVTMVDFPQELMKRMFKHMVVLRFKSTFPLLIGPACGTMRQMDDQLDARKHLTTKNNNGQTLVMPGLNRH